LSDEIKCKECGQTFLSDEELEEHMKQHERASTLFQCDKCKMSLGTREELERHLLEVHVNKN
jgi:NAD-dependent SIR2 family protein deacetylase